MVARKSMQDYQSVGFGGLAFLTHINLANTPMQYEQRWWSLDAQYHFTLAKIEEDQKYKEDPEIVKLVHEIRGLLDRANTDYKSQFEGHETNNDDENNFKLLLSIIMGKLTQLQGKTKMIEKVTMEQEAIER